MKPPPRVSAAPGLGSQGRTQKIHLDRESVAILRHRCDRCGTHVQDGEGWLCCDDARDRTWHVWHRRCDPRIGGGYVVPVEELRTAVDLIEWQLHLAGKGWVGSTDWNRYSRRRLLPQLRAAKGRGTPPRAAVTDMRPCSTSEQVSDLHDLAWSLGRYLVVTADRQDAIVGNAVAVILGHIKELQAQLEPTRRAS